VFKKPDNIGHFFKEFDIRCTHHNVASDQEKIEMLVCYLSADHAQNWKATTKYKNWTNTTYANFNTKILSLYPGSIHSSDNYTLGELKHLWLLIAQCQ
jgi:hypothetical protein